MNHLSAYSSCFVGIHVQNVSIIQMTPKRESGFFLCERWLINAMDVYLWQCKQPSVFNCQLAAICCLKWPDYATSLSGHPSFFLSAFKYFYKHLDHLIYAASSPKQFSNSVLPAIFHLSLLSQGGVKLGERDRERERQRERDRDRQRQRHRERDRERTRESSKKSMPLLVVLLLLLLLLFLFLL